MGIIGESDIHHGKSGDSNLRPRNAWWRAQKGTMGDKMYNESHCVDTTDSDPNWDDNYQVQSGQGESLTRVNMMNTRRLIRLW